VCWLGRWALPSPIPGTLCLSPSTCWSPRCSLGGPGRTPAALTPPCAAGKGKVSCHGRCQRHPKAAAAGSCQPSCLDWLKSGFFWARGPCCLISPVFVPTAFLQAVPGRWESSEPVLSPNLSLQGSSFCPVTQLISSRFPSSIQKEQTLPQKMHSSTGRA